METFTTKLGKTRAGDRTRIWLEGSRLDSHGFKVGMHFTKMFHADPDCLTIIACTRDVFLQSERAERGTVSGKGETPIIDITGKLVAETFGSGSHVKVIYRPRRIIITKQEG